MKTKKKLAGLLAIIMAAMMMTACTSGTESDDEDTSGSKPSSSQQDKNDNEADADDSDEASDSEEAVKSDGYEKFSQLKIGMTEDEVNAILGEPAKADKAYYYYNITVNGKDMELELWINITTGKVTYINGNFSGSDYRDEFRDENVDLSSASKLESDEITTYDECVAAFKTSGHLSSVTEDDEKTYFWVDANGGYMRISCRADGTIKSFIGYC